MSIVLKPGLPQLCVLRFEGPLRVPVSRDLRRRVREALHDDARHLVLDLERVVTIDAAGVGELVRAFNMTAAADGMLSIVHTTARVREMLERANLFDLLTGDLGAPVRRLSA